jgi:hypothetical protein
MINTVPVLAALMYVVLLAPIWLFLGLRLAIWFVNPRNVSEGWFARAKHILEDPPDDSGPRHR